MPAAVVSAGSTLQERGDQAVLSEDQRVGVARSLLLHDPRGNDGACVLFSGSSLPGPCFITRMAVGLRASQFGAPCLRL